MYKICIFAGTTEGRSLAEFLSNKECDVTVCVATEYGEVLLKDSFAHIKTGRMNKEEMSDFFCNEKFNIVVDATHPYAEIVSDNILLACKEQNTEYLRINRSDCNVTNDELVFDTIDDAVEYLKDRVGNILVTTGSKELYKYIQITDYKERIYPRVLPVISSIEICNKYEYKTGNILAMQGPFSEDVNISQIKAYNIKFLVTKNSGNVGGFDEKLSACKKCGIQCIVIGRPMQNSGVTYNEAIKIFDENLKDKDINAKNIVINLVAMGTGNILHRTYEADDILKNCDAVIGSKRLLEEYNNKNKPQFIGFTSKDIINIVENNSQYKNYAVLLSGDIGFYSGAKKLTEKLTPYTVKHICGVSSLVYFSAKLGIPWQDLNTVSLHGLDSHYINEIDKNYRTFLLLGGENTVNSVCKNLCEYGLSNLKVYIGEDLGSKNEKITVGTAENQLNGAYSPLSVMIVENSSFHNNLYFGIDDDNFIRTEKVPMTKSEVRAISLAKLNLTKNSVVYDIGAGTGSVSVEIALNVPKGKVYAVEKNAGAVETMRKNKINFKVDNLEVKEGLAPENLKDLPMPTHAFIGGSSGNLAEIIDVILSKNPHTRIVINTITVETFIQVAEVINKYDFATKEIAQVNISRSKPLGKYLSMVAQNPINIITLQM